MRRLVSCKVPESQYRWIPAIKFVDWPICYYCNQCKPSSSASSSIDLTRPPIEETVTYLSTQLAKLSVQFNVFNKVIESRIVELEKGLQVYVDDKIASASVELTDNFTKKITEMEQSTSLRLTQNMTSIHSTLLKENKAF